MLHIYFSWCPILSFSSISPFIRSPSPGLSPIRIPFWLLISLRARAAGLGGGRQGGDEKKPSFPYSCKFPYSFRFFWSNEDPTSPKEQSLLGQHLQSVCPCQQNQFEHYSVYTLAMILWLQKRRDGIFDKGWPWHSLNPGKSWLNEIFLKLQNRFFLHVQLEEVGLLKYFFFWELQPWYNRNMPKQKPIVTSYHVIETDNPLCLRCQPWAN